MIMTLEVTSALACVWSLALTSDVLAAGASKTGSLYLSLRARLLNNGFIDICSL